MHEVQAFRYLTGGEPFSTATAHYNGAKIVRPGYDLQPSAMYDPEDTARPYKMWWLCSFNDQYGKQTDDLPPYDLDASDRICFSHAKSPDGPWSTPQAVLKGLGGSAGSPRGDDHLVGSPSVLRINCAAISCPSGISGKPYVMFYEAYGNYMTRVNRFFSGANGDTFVTGGDPSWPSDVQGTSYSYEGVILGYAPYLKSSGTKPVYSCQVIYPDGKVNRYLQRGTPCPVKTDANGTWSGLNKGFRYGVHQSIPVFWTYDGPRTVAGVEQRQKLYRCYDVTFRNTFASIDAGCEGRNKDGELGWVSKGWLGANVLASDMVGAAQNRVHLAYSTDGTRWTRFNGGATDGSWAVVIPGDQKALGMTPCNGDEQFSFHRTYGAGYPSALTRDGYLEVFFQDHTTPENNRDLNCSYGEAVIHQRVRVSLGSLFSQDAWRQASGWSVRGKNASSGSDIKWSPVLNRYFSFQLRILSPVGIGPDSNAFEQAPELTWSDPNPPKTGALDMAYINNPARAFDNAPATHWNDSNSGRWAIWGAILGTTDGHLLWFPSHPTPHFAIHLYYSAIRSGYGVNYSLIDIDQILILAYPK